MCGLVGGEVEWHSRCRGQLAGMCTVFEYGEYVSFAACGGRKDTLHLEEPRCLADCLAGSPVVVGDVVEVETDRCEGGICSEVENRQVCDLDRVEFVATRDEALRCCT